MKPIYNTIILFRNSRYGFLSQAIIKTEHKVPTNDINYCVGTYTYFLYMYLYYRFKKTYLLSIYFQIRDIPTLVFEFLKIFLRLFSVSDMSQLDGESTNLSGQVPTQSPAQRILLRNEAFPRRRCLHCLPARSEQRNSFQHSRKPTTRQLQEQIHKTTLYH